MLGLKLIHVSKMGPRPSVYIYNATNVKVYGRPYKRMSVESVELIHSLSL